MRCTTRIAAALAAVAFVSYASTASAAAYAIQQALSTITITGNVADVIAIVAQSPGSNVVSFQGTINSSNDGSDILFSGGDADADLQAAPQSPGPGGVVGTAPADAGLAIGPGLGTIAVRDFHISLTGGPTALTAGTFDLTALTLTITSGTLDFNVPAFSLVGTEDLSGTTASPTAGVGTLVGDILTIPVLVTTQFEVSDGVFAVVNLTGQVVAVVPEPGTIAMLGMGLVGLVAVGRRRFRRA